MKHLEHRCHPARIQRLLSDCCDVSSARKSSTVGATASPNCMLALSSAMHLPLLPVQPVQQLALREQRLLMDRHDGRCGKDLHLQERPGLLQTLQTRSARCHWRPLPATAPPLCRPRPRPPDAALASGASLCWGAHVLAPACASSSCVESVPIVRAPQLGARTAPPLAA
jgi:hypothetical protein